MSPFYCHSFCFHDLRILWLANLALVTRSVKTNPQANSSQYWRNLKSVSPRCLLCFQTSQPKNKAKNQRSLRVVMARRKARSLQSRSMKRREIAIFKSTGDRNFHGLLQTNLEGKCTASTAEKMKL